jgi:hypothetical protein
VFDGYCAVHHGAIGHYVRVGVTSDRAFGCQRIPMSAIPPTATRFRNAAKWREGPMLLKKSFWGAEQIFLEALVRQSENDVGGHTISPISDRQLS